MTHVYSTDLSCSQDGSFGQASRYEQVVAFNNAGYNSSPFEHFDASHNAGTKIAQVLPTDPTEERDLVAVIQGANVAALRTDNDYLDVGDGVVGDGETFPPEIFDEVDDSEPNLGSGVAGQPRFLETNIVDAAAAKLLADKQREEMEANKRKLLHEKKMLLTYRKKPK